MIIILKGADFSASNIGTLSTWRITRSLGAGATYDGPVSVDKEGALTATVTLDEGYELNTTGVTVTMGGEVVSDAANVQGNIIYISIPVVTGNVVIKVPTVNIGGGEEPEILLTALSVDYTQGDYTYFEAQDIEDLRRHLTVHASYSDGNDVIITDYTLSGTLQTGTSTITVAKDGCNTTFEVETTEFALPEGYTRYGYIEGKNTSKGTARAQTDFIWLPAFENINALSLEMTLGQKSSPAANAAIGCFGARPASGLGWTVYWNEASSSDWFWVQLRNKQTTIPTLPAGLNKIKLVIDNPENPPYKVYVDNQLMGTGAWTAETDTVLSREISLFNNIPEGNTSTMYVNFTVRIGDMLFRDSTGNCVAYYTPCTDANNKIGMYDQISKQFYTAATASAVTVGNSGVRYKIGNW